MLTVRENDSQASAVCESVTDQQDTQMCFMYYCILCLTYTREKASVLRTLIISGCQGIVPMTSTEAFPLLSESFSRKQLSICCTTEYLQEQGGACGIYSLIIKQ